MRVAVTGANGRLGRALVAALTDARAHASIEALAWTRPEYDLDRPGSAQPLLDRDEPDVVIHTAAWTDVDACALDPDSAMRRNGSAAGDLARACAARGRDLVLVSTNEVFDGRRSDGLGYDPADPVGPINPYGASKLAGENAAREAFGTSRTGRQVPRLAIVRTAWLFGPPGGDFPAKILDAVDRVHRTGKPIRVVGNELGSPTYSVDLAAAIVDLLGSGMYAGVHHIVNAGIVSRASWAIELVRQAGLEAVVEEVPAAAWPRASTPPSWGALSPTCLPRGKPLRPWHEAQADYLPFLLRGRA